MTGFTAIEILKRWTGPDREVPAVEECGYSDGFRAVCPPAAEASGTDPGVLFFIR
jgi:hypothetical protein